MKACRICMKKHDGMTNIFEGDDKISDRILFCTGVQFTNEDGLPQQMCSNCLSDLSVAHRFKTSCIAIANNTFRSIITTGIKDEDDDDYVKYDDCIEGDCLILKVEDEKNSNKELAEVKTVVSKKRGPYKKNGKLKRKKKDVQMKVKKKGTQGYNKSDTELEYCLKRVRCEPCGLVFDSRAAAITHRETKHKNEAWVCEICGQKFIHRGSLSTHIRSHFPPTFACQQCSYRAAHKHDLTKHQRRHTGDRPFQCDMCPANFHDTSNMKSHIRRHHQKLMNYRCEVCGRGFYDRSKLNRHVDSHNNIKRHSCVQCGCAFTRLSYLKTHLHKRHGVSMPALKPGRQRRNLIVDVPPEEEYVKPSLIAVKPDTQSS